jgi:hypothetical protein
MYYGWYESDWVIRPQENQNSIYSDLFFIRVYAEYYSGLRFIIYIFYFIIVFYFRKQSKTNFIIIFNKQNKLILIL